MEIASRLLGAYQRGVITRMELIGRLIELAADTPPEQIAPLLPTDCLGELENLSTHPPATPADAPRSFAIVTAVGPIDYQVNWQREQRLWHEGAWSWHRYFRSVSTELGAEHG